MRQLQIITSLYLRIEQPFLRAAARGHRTTESFGMIRNAKQLFDRNGELPTWINGSQFSSCVQSCEAKAAKPKPNVGSFQYGPPRYICLDQLEEIFTKNYIGKDFANQGTVIASSFKRV